MTKKTKAVSDEEKDLIKNPVNVFRCGACENAKELEFAEFKNHLKEVHQLDIENKETMKGNRQMVMHMDGDFWFSSTYDWTLVSGLKFYQFVKMARAKYDFMRF